MKLHNLLTDHLILAGLESRTRNDVLEEMVGFLKAQKMITKEKELYEKLVHREELGTTSVGEGVAIPHCKIDGLKAPILMFGLSKEGVPFGSPDGKLTHAFFLVVSPPDNPGLNLQILAAIAQLVRKSQDLTARLLAAMTPPRICRVLREEEDRIHEK